MTEERFEKKVKPILTYVGTIGAILMGIAYIATVLVMVFGFTVVANVSQSIVFAAINAVMGLVIMQFLKVQGIDLAKALDKNKDTLNKYNSTKTRDKKFRSLRHFWWTTFLKDFIVKGFTIGITTLGIIYIVICGNSNYSWLLLAVVNLVMFACFGLLALVKAYDFFNESYIPYITEKLNEADEERIKAEFEAAEKAAKEREKIIEAEVQRRVALAKKELTEQKYDRLCNCGGADILESSVDMCPTCANSESMVLECSNDSDNILGGAIHTCDRTSDTVHSSIEKNTLKNKIQEEIK